MDSPGACPICGAPHSACYPGRITQPLPPGLDVPPAPPLFAEQVQATLPPEQFTTGTYRRKPRGKT